MMNNRPLYAFALAALAGLGAAPLACGSSGDLGTGTGDDGGADVAVVSADAGAITDDGACPLAPLAAACTANGDCCSNLCFQGTCVASIAACGATGDACTVNTDCCNGSCVNGMCGAAQCTSIGDPCPSGGGACCTATCVAGKCAAIGTGTLPDGGTGTVSGGGGSCTTAGNKCAKNGDCCSGLCTSGTCNIASSFCIQTNDMCFHSVDCCGGVCTAPNGQPVSTTNPGLCGAPPKVGGVNCSGVDGTLCDPSQIGCASGCCSHLCAPYGPTGVAICQQAQGCHVEGDLCRKDGDCCGGESPDSGILGAGLVKCTIPAGSAIGYCTTPTSSGSGGVCVPEGDVCHYTSDPNYTCPSSAARSDCCGDQTPKFLACRLDKLGVPRCLAYGLADGGTDACRQAGQTCATAADCCNGDPCVPNAAGQLVCGAASCVPTTGACTANADCCAGETCVIPVGGSKGTCSAIPPSGGTGDAGTGGGGTSDAGTGLGCADLGQSCASLGCCTGLVCSGGSCTIIR